MLRRLVAFALLALPLGSCGSEAPPRAALAATPRPIAVPTSAPKPTPGGAEGFGAPASLALSKSSLREQGASEELLRTVDRSAYRYFRLLARPFEARTCWAFRDMRWHLPVAAVHGDAHLEQFVVTHATYGLEDFDDAGYGPAVVDLVRYGASIHLACREVGSFCDASRAVERYFDAYRSALDAAPPAPSSAPRVVERLRSRSPRDRATWLAWTDHLATPLAPSIESRARAGWRRFVDDQREIDPARPSAFYEIQSIGRLRMGLGSALEQKVLIRIRGATDDPGDDLVLEARASGTEASPGCISRPTHGGSMQVLTFMSVLGRRMPNLFGFATLADDADAHEVWVQSWDPGYTELSLADIHDEAELEEVVEDAARQLAGHFWTRFPEPLRGHQRHAQLRAFDATRERATALAAQLSAEVVGEWKRFRADP